MPDPSLVTPATSCHQEPNRPLDRPVNVPLWFSTGGDKASPSPFFDDERVQVEGNGIRILIVEDEALVALDMAMILDAAGYQVIDTKPTGDSALAALKTAADSGALPDLVLMDIALRGALDGIETTRQIKSAYAGIPIVFVTGQADPITRARAETTAPAGYLLKPFTPEQLVGFVKSVIHR